MTTDPGLARVLGAALRHARATTGLSQRAVAAAAGVAATTVEGLEADRSATPASQRALHATGHLLWAVPAPPADPALDARQWHRFSTRHALDRVQDLVLADGRDVAGLPALEWLDELDALTDQPALLMGWLAALAWLPSPQGVPQLDRVTIALRAGMLPRTSSGRTLRARVEVVRVGPDLSLPPPWPSHLWRLSLPVRSDGHGLRIQHLRDLVTVLGAHPELVRAALIVDGLVRLDDQGRRPPTHARSRLPRSLSAVAYQGRAPLPAERQRRQGWAPPPREEDYDDLDDPELDAPGVHR